MIKLICPLLVASLLGLPAVQVFSAIGEGRSPMPQRNDVTMRTLRFRDVPPGSPQDPFAALEAFHANRLEWVYLDFTEQEREKVARVKASGRIFGGAGSSALHSWIGADGQGGSHERMAMLDLEGNIVISPHKRGWKSPPPTGDPSNPEFLEGHIRYYKQYLEYGADTLQRDEVRGFVMTVTKQGGGFTETGLAGFRDWLKQNLSSAALGALGIDDIDTFSYAAYLIERKAPVGDAFATYTGPLLPFWKAYWQDVSVEFFQKLIREVKASTDRPLTFSCNNSSLQVWDPETLEFDFAISELLLGSANPRHIWERSEAARAVGKFQVFGSPKTRGTDVDSREKVQLTRRVIATAYACGMASRVPWDIFEQTEDGTGRYFGEPENYADLYAFVSKQDWKGYDEIYAQGPDIVDTRLPSGAIRVIGNDHVYQFLQQSRMNGNPLLLHLVDWGAQLVPAPDKKEMSYVESAQGERVYFSRDGMENLKRTGPTAFTLQLDMDFLGLDAESSLSLLVPTGFDALQNSGNPVKRRQVPGTVENGILTVELDPLTPWGILEIDR